MRGGGLESSVFADTTLDRCTILRNSAPEGGGAFMLEDPPYYLFLTLDSLDSDWGVDADDNVPDDVVIGSTSVSGYGAGATFTCHDGSCTPTP